MVTYGADNSSILNLNAVCFPHTCIMVKSVMSAVLRGKVLGVFLWKTKNWVAIGWSLGRVDDWYWVLEDYNYVLLPNLVSLTLRWNIYVTSTERVLSQNSSIYKIISRPQCPLTLQSWFKVSQIEPTFTVFYYIFLGSILTYKAYWDKQSKTVFILLIIRYMEPKGKVHLLPRVWKHPSPETL